MAPSALRTVCLALLGLSACGGNGVPAEAPQAGPPPVAQPAPKPRDHITRAEVDQTVDAGLGHFLQRVELEPSLSSGKFVGFRIVSLHPAEFWQGVDLAPGDVVTRVNGRSIERDSDAYATFMALKSAKELRVTFLRGGQERELVYPILDAQSPAKKADAG